MEVQRSNPLAALFFWTLVGICMVLRTLAACSRMHAGCALCRANFFGCRVCRLFHSLFVSPGRVFLFVWRSALSRSNGSAACSIKTPASVRLPGVLLPCDSDVMESGTIVSISEDSEASIDAACGERRARERRAACSVRWRWCAVAAAARVLSGERLAY